jgi:hypothetical protein
MLLVVGDFLIQGRLKIIIFLPVFPLFLCGFFLWGSMIWGRRGRTWINWCGERINGKEGRTVQPAGLIDSLKG